MLRMLNHSWQGDKSGYIWPSCDRVVCCKSQGGAPLRRVLGENL